MNFDLKGDPTVGTERLKDIVACMGFKKGKQVASLLDRAPAYRVRKIPTGIFELDWKTHGGIPIDRITRISGKRNSCKTTTLLKVLANAQKYCRYCVSPIVVLPDTGEKDCRCPNPRYTLEDSDKLQFLKEEECRDVLEGRVPPSAKMDKDVWTIGIGQGRPRAVLEQTYRCAPFQTLFVETERKLDARWAELNGVDTSLVVVLGLDWAESLIDTLEELLYTGQLDLVIVDTMSMLVPRDSLEKSMEETPKVASRAVIKQRLLEKVLACQQSRGLAEKGVTFVCASQVRTQGIGGYRTYLGASDGNAADHLMGLDLVFREKGYKYIHHEYASSGEFEFEVRKNHCGGSPGVSGTFHMWLDPKGPYSVGDTDDQDKVIRYAREFDLISEQKGKLKYNMSSPYKEGGYGFRLLGQVEEFLVENPTVYSTLRKEVLERMIHLRTPKKEKK